MKVVLCMLAFAPIAAMVAAFTGEAGLDVRDVDVHDVDVDPDRDRGHAGRPRAAHPGRLGDVAFLLDPDAGVRHAGGVLPAVTDVAFTRLTPADAARWRPWRGYATQYLWATARPPDQPTPGGTMKHRVVDSPGRPADPRRRRRPARWSGSRWPTSATCRTPPPSASATTPSPRRPPRSSREYFAGTRDHFDLALAPVGHAFQHRVWDAAARHPLRRDLDLRPARHPPRHPGRVARGGPGQRAQPPRHRRPLPPRGRGGRLAHGLRGRRRAQAVAAGPRAGPAAARPVPPLRGRQSIRGPNSGRMTVTPTPRFGRPRARSVG